MEMKWTESSIRKELARLDEKTGLNGASLPISFNNAKCTLGLYCSENGGSFRFSNYYFQNPEWPVEEALDVIRHEYAHHMDHVIYDGHGHGATWKYCCRSVGALLIQCYNDQRAKYHQHKHAEEAKLSEHLDGYRIGCCIDHPVYGVGTIKNIIGESVNRCITVDFSGVGIKKLGLAWVDKYCRRCG